MKNRVVAVLGTYLLLRAGPWLAAFMACRIDTNSTQNLMKDVMTPGLDRAGRPKWSSSQNDLHSPVARDPAVDEVTDLNRPTYRRSCTANLIVVIELSVGQACSKVVP